MIRFGGDLDDPGVDPFGLHGQVESVLFEQAADSIRAMGGCGEIYTDDNGEKQMCLIDRNRCELHHPELVARHVKLFDRYVGTLARWWRR